MIGVLLKSIGYFFLFPIVFIALSYVLYRKKEDLLALSNIKTEDEVTKNSIKKSYSRIRKIEIAFVLTILIFMPFMYLLGGSYTQDMVHREERGGVALERSFPILDPVIYQIGPTEDIKEVKNEIEKDDHIWHPGQLKEKVDFEHLNKFPGKFSLYRLLDNRLIVIYHYISPVPTYKSYGFMIEVVNKEEKLLLMKKDTIVYPMNPDRCSKVFIS